jgi:hypothetical protein
LGSGTQDQRSGLRTKSSWILRIKNHQILDPRFRSPTLFMTNSPIKVIKKIIVILNEKD